MSLDPARRAGLERSRATAIAREQFEIDIDTASVDAAPFGVVVDDGERAVIVSSSDDLAVLGGVLVWVGRNPRAQVDLIVEHHAGVHARRAAALAPEIDVHRLDGSRVMAATPDPIGDPHETPSDVTPLIAMIERSGADAVTEDGIVRAEVAGLEVGRVVIGPSGSVLEVGVGRFDREAGALLHADRPVEPTLVDTIEQVRVHRHVGAASHPINRIGRERWLRAMVLQDPSAFGLASPTLVEPVPPRSSLLEKRSAALLSVDGDERRLVVCTVGADLGLVPELADLLAVTGADQLTVIAPERDLLPYLADLLALLPIPADQVAIDPPWVA